MPHLLNVWPSVKERLQSASRVLLFLDYDGTLTPIVSQPDLAKLSPQTRDLLRDLNARQRFVLGVISGRGLGDLQELVGVPGLVYAGNHGLEIEADGQRFLHPEADALRDGLARLHRKLSETMSEFSGVIVEDKGLTLSVHYRLTPEELARPVEDAFNSVVADCAEFRITRGKKVLEVRPRVDWDKGKAILRVVDRFSNGSLPVFFGDDLTDEAGFDAVQERGGIAVLVGEARQPTRALYRVDSPAEVVRALRLMCQLE